MITKISRIRTVPPDNYRQFLFGAPYLFGFKDTGQIFISSIKYKDDSDDEIEYEDIYEDHLDPNYIGTNITSFYLEKQPYIYALRMTGDGNAYIFSISFSKFTDRKLIWKQVGVVKYDHDYIATTSFEFEGKPYIFGLRIGFSLSSC